MVEMRLHCCLLERFLQRAGHTVVSCTCATEAWACFEPEPEAFSLVIADLTLPDGSGDGLVRRMLEHNPALSVIVSTGYPFDLESLGIGDLSRAAFLQKPFLPRVLGEVLARIGVNA